MPTAPCIALFGWVSTTSQAHTPARHLIATSAGYPQPQMSLTQLQQPSEVVSDHLGRARHKLHFMHLAFQPPQTADPPSPVRRPFGHPNILAQPLLRASPVASRPQAAWGPRAIAEEPESISACPAGRQRSWQAIVRAQPELQFIHRILIICCKASVPGGHPGIVYFCKEWLF